MEITTQKERQVQLSYLVPLHLPKKNLEILPRVLMRQAKSSISYIYGK